MKKILAILVCGVFLLQADLVKECEVDKSAGACADILNSGKKLSKKKKLEYQKIACPLYTEFCHEPCQAGDSASCDQEETIIMMRNYKYE